MVASVTRDSTDVQAKQSGRDLRAARNVLTHAGRPAMDREMAHVSDEVYLTRVVKPLLQPLIRDLKTYRPECPAEFIATWAEDIDPSEQDRYFDERCAETIEALTNMLLEARPASPRDWLGSVSKDA